MPCSSKTKYAVFLLPICCCILPLYYHVLRNDLSFILPAALGTSLAIFVLFPDLANYFFRSGTSFDDLIDKHCGDDPERWQRMFTKINAVLSALLVTFIVYYVIQKYRWAEIMHKLDLSHGVSMEIIDTIGIAVGLVNLFRKWQVIIGKCVINLIYMCKLKIRVRVQG